MNSSPNATTVSMPDWWAAWACAIVSTPISRLEAEGRCYYALTSTTKDYMKHTKQPQYNTTFTIQAGVKYCF
ncbi:MAG: hypothetical protein ACLUE2_14645 [Bacteroides cellulosilyticus]